MRKLVASAVLLAVAAAASLAAPPEAPAVIKAKPGQLVRIPIKSDAEVCYLKNFGDSDAFFGELVSPKGYRHFVFQPPSLEPDGSYKGKAQYVLGFWTKGEGEGVATTIEVDGQGVKPVVPPKPVDPVVPPGPPLADAPIKADGLHVLVVYDPKTLSSMSEEQKAALFSTDVRGYLNEKCPQRAENGYLGWNMWPDGADVSGATKLWQDAYARKRGSLPWIIVSNGKTGAEQQAPQTKDAMLALLKQYGG